MRLFRLVYLFAVVTLLNVYGRAQVQSEIVGSPHSCRNELGQYEISYGVRNRFTDSMQVPVTVKIGITKIQSFLLFSSSETTNPASAVYLSNPDFVEGPPTRTIHLRPGEHADWSAVATITIAGPGSRGRLPKAGHYFLLPLPGLDINGHPMSQDDMLSKSRLIPLTIEEPQSNVPACKR